MQVTLDIPDSLATQIAPEGQSLSRALLEAALIQAYREDRLTGHELMVALGLETRYELDGVLKAHQVWIEYTPEMMAADQKYQDAFLAEYFQKSA